MYPTNRRKYGIADQFGWRNIHNARTGIDWRLTGKWNLAVDDHFNWIASRNDSLYGASGLPVTRNASATSRFAGGEVDIFSDFRWSEHVQFAAHIFPGGYLRRPVARRQSPGCLLFECSRWGFEMRLTYTKKRMERLSS